MDKSKYTRRIIETNIKDILTYMGGVVITGPRDCGKSWTAEMIGGNIHKMDADENEVNKFYINSELFFSQQKPMVIDEWQVVENMWNKVRDEINKSTEFGQFILTGSAAPAPDSKKHTGAGRIASIQMYTMSYSEENTSSKEVEFDHLIDGTKVYGASKFGLDEHIEHIIKGGWPRLCALDYLKAGMAVEKYVDSIVNADFKKISGKSNSKTTEKIMNAISRNLLTHASIEKIAEEAYINTKTLSRYTKLLSDINVLEYVDAWKPHIRSSIRINMKPKWNWTDPSIAVASLQLSKDKLLNDLQYTGFLFESLVGRDLKIYSQSIGAKIYYYQDKEKLEVDYIIELKNGDIIAIEVKLGGEKLIKDGIESLKAFKRKIETSKIVNVHKICSLNIFVSNGLSYTTNDGINIINFGHFYKEY